MVKGRGGGRGGRIEKKQRIVSHEMFTNHGVTHKLRGRNGRGISAVRILNTIEVARYCYIDTQTCPSPKILNWYIQILSIGL